MTHPATFIIAPFQPSVGAAEWRARIDRADLGFRD